MFKMGTILENLVYMVTGYKNYFVVSSVLTLIKSLSEWKYCVHSIKIKCTCYKNRKFKKEWTCLSKHVLFTAYQSMGILILKIIYHTFHQTYYWETPLTDLSFLSFSQALIH